MKLRDWIRATPPAEREAICKEIGTKMDYLWQIAGGHSRPGARMALAIEAATGVSRHELRPDIYPINDRPRPLPPSQEAAA